MPTSPPINLFDGFSPVSILRFRLNMVSKYDHLPIETQSGETTTTYLMAEVKYLKLGGGNHLVKEIQQFQTVSSRITDGLIDRDQPCPLDREYDPAHELPHLVCRHHW